ncbi:MAG: DNA repair protein RecO [Burkholderiaceae bacterium]
MATRAPRAAAPVVAYVLHRYDWSESSLILDLYTRELGRVAVAARGVKRPYSQWRSVLLPFQRLHAGFGRAAASEVPAEVLTLRSAEWAGGAAMLTGDALFSGFYVNELLMKLLARGDPHPALFDAYACTLPALAAAADSEPEAALRAFELMLLRHTGVLPDLAHVTQTQQPLRPDARYALQAQSGVVTVASADEPGLNAQALLDLQAAIDADDVGALQAACAGDLPALKGMLRAVLHYHLGSSPLRTRQVMLDLQKLERASP